MSTGRASPRFDIRLGTKQGKPVSQILLASTPEKKNGYDQPHMVEEHMECANGARTRNLLDQFAVRR